MMDRLVYPLRRIWISAGPYDHGYNADDLGWWDPVPSDPDNSGRNPYVYAMASGVVTQIVNSHPDDPDWEGYGNYIVISYPSLNMWSLFAHIKKNSFLVKVGDKVSQLQPVARMGNSGYSYGNHVHMEVGYGSFVRHGGVDPTTVTYATDWHIVDSDTEKEYNILHMVIEPTDEDVTKMQLLVECDDLNIREQPTTSSKSLGFAPKGFYNVSETTGDEILWCKVEDYYLANVDGTQLVEASFVPVERDESRDQAEVTINDLRIRYEPSTSSRILGYAPEGFYNIEETHAGDDYVWFKVCEAWIACVDGVNYLPSEEDPKDKRIKELEEENAFLTKRLEDTEEALYNAAQKNIFLTDAVEEIRAICDKVTQE